MLYFGKINFNTQQNIRILRDLQHYLSFETKQYALGLIIALDMAPM